MGKPNGARLDITADGPHFSVSRISRTEDLIWDAVQEAIACGWAPEQFRDEVRAAWAQALKDAAKAADEVFRT